MNRLVAVLIAVAMVVVAVVVRDRIDDDGGGGGGGGGGPARLLCAAELEPACLDLDRERDDVVVEIAPAGTTLDELSTLPDAELDDLGVDGWLAPAPYSVMVNRARGFSQLEPAFEEPSDPVARSPLIIAVRRDQGEVLAGTPECAGELSWTCVGDLARRDWVSIGGDPLWGRIRAGQANPTSSAVGLLVLGQATSEYLGTTDIDATVLESDPGFATWFSRLEGSGSVSSFRDVLNQNFNNFNVVGTTEAEAGPALANARADLREQVELLYVDPVATADLVLALTTTTERGGRLENVIESGDARQALAEAGWRVVGEDPAPGVGNEDLPDTSNLPGPIGLEAIQSQWELL